MITPEMWIWIGSILIGLGTVRFAIFEFEKGIELTISEDQIVREEKLKRFRVKGIYGVYMTDPKFDFKGVVRLGDIIELEEVD